MLQLGYPGPHCREYSSKKQKIHLATLGEGGLHLESHLQRFALSDLVIAKFNNRVNIINSHFYTKMN